MSDAETFPSTDANVDDLFEAAIRRHDALIEAAGLCIWHGSEPTFTDRRSETPEWLYAAGGAIKPTKAGEMARRLCADFAPSLLLRSVGRQYPSEDAPRWCFGLLGRRDHAPLWSGPLDPLLGGGASPASALSRFRQALIERLEASGWAALAYDSPVSPRSRVVFRRDGETLPNPEQEPDLHKPSPHEEKTPDSGLADVLARAGIFVLSVGFEPATERPDETGVARVELPEFSTPKAFAAFLEVLEAAAQEAGLQGMILAGYPPPIDASLIWHTLTPDPAVVEVNMAPAAVLSECLDWLRKIHAAAARVGLTPYRFQYNGDVADSGGGGHITFGGPSPEASPFLLHPHLLPNLIRYCNRHPALSYFFTPSCVGASSQSPRTDETSREAFEELQLSLDLLARRSELSPTELWASLSPFLRDSAGNSHRCEINVEKLWNAGLPSRGQLGLVEMRAFLMAHDPEAQAARIALIRSLLGLLSAEADIGVLTDWGNALHDRFALPFFLKRDLREIFRELRERGFGLAPILESRLIDDDHRVIGRLSLGDCALTVTRALEFWPLVGDSASQEAGSSRLIDSSTNRLEILLRPNPCSSADIDAWRLAVAGRLVPFGRAEDADGSARVVGVRYRAFKPGRGLHPTLGVQAPVPCVLCDERGGRAWRVAIHEWKPAGGGYAGLPADWADSVERRRERLAREEIPLAAFRAEAPPEGACTEWCLDLRRLRD
jgi:uncharacterized protein (DUF2126 family)